MNTLTLKIALIAGGLASSLGASEVPKLQIERKDCDPATGTVEFTLVNRYGSPAVAWSLQVLSVDSDGRKAKFGILEDRQDFLDPERWVSETPPERGYVPAGGELRQSLKAQPDVGGFAAITIEVRAVVYEDVAAAGDPAVIERIFAGRVAQLLATSDALTELFKARVSGAGVDSILGSLLERRVAARPSSGQPAAQDVEGSRGTVLELRYRNLYEASMSPDPALWIDDLAEEWAERVRRIARAIRPSDRERWKIGFDGEVVGEGRP